MAPRLIAGKETTMRIRTLTLGLCAAALLALAPAARADDEATSAKLLTAKASSVVSVKLVLNIKMMRGGAAMGPPQEQSTSAVGVVVDSAGLIMLPAAALGGDRTMNRRGQGFTISARPSSIRVVFPGDPKEYQAVIGAKDSKLGLGFILIRDLAGKTVTPLDLATKSEPKPGQTLYSVMRLGQGFDYAPMVVRTRVAGEVTKPRAMWILQGANSSAGKPLYDAAGALTGIVVSQKGVGEEAATRAFLLPLSVALPTIKNSLAKSKAELERTLEEEEEAAAEAEAEGKDSEKKDGEEKADENKDDEKKDEGTKDDK
jgi:hypothetical protein